MSNLELTGKLLALNQISDPIFISTIVSNNCSISIKIYSFLSTRLFEQEGCLYHSY